VAHGTGAVVVSVSAEVWVSRGLIGGGALAAAVACSVGETGSEDSVGEIPPDSLGGCAQFGSNAKLNEWLSDTSRPAHCAFRSYRIEPLTQCCGIQGSLIVVRPGFSATSNVSRYCYSDNPGSKTPSCAVASTVELELFKNSAASCTWLPPHGNVPDSTPSGE
jgi:hypothetical protein